MYVELPASVSDVEFVKCILDATAEPKFGLYGWMWCGGGCEAISANDALCNTAEWEWAWWWWCGSGWANCPCCDIDPLVYYYREKERDM